MDAAELQQAEPSIGLMVPATNRVLEPDFKRWLPVQVPLYVNRLNAPKARPVDMRENLEVLTSGLGEIARLLGLARPSMIAFGCTSASFLRGSEWDANACRTIAENARTGNVITTAQSVVAAFGAIRARRLAVITPYPDTVNKHLVSFLQQAGQEVRSLSAIDGWTAGIDKLQPAEIADFVTSAPRNDVDAVFVSCTNLRASEHIEELESRLSLPVITSNQATFWACAAQLGMATRIPGLGSLGAASYLRGGEL